MAKMLLKDFLFGIKKVVNNNYTFEALVLWLCNTLRLLHNLKQYSGLVAFKLENSPRQNNHSLKNFDLSEYRKLLGDVTIWILGKISKNMEEWFEPLIASALLEREEIAFSPSKRTRALSLCGRPKLTQGNSDELLSEMTLLLETLQDHGVDLQIMVHIFKQLFHTISATALKHLLERGELCNCRKGMQIR